MIVIFPFPLAKKLLYQAILSDCV